MEGRDRARIGLLIKPGTCFTPSATWQSPSHVKSTPPAASAHCVGNAATIPSGQPLEHLPRSPVGGWDPRGRPCCLLRGRRSRVWLPAAERSGSSALGRASAPRAGHRRVRAALLPPRSVPCCQLAEGPLALPAGHSLAAAQARRRRGGKKPAHRSQPRVPGRLRRPCLRSGLPKVRGRANRSPRAHQYPPRRPHQGDTEGSCSSPET